MVRIFGNDAVQVVTILAFETSRPVLSRSGSTRFCAIIKNPGFDRSAGRAIYNPGIDFCRCAVPMILATRPESVRRS